MNYSVQPSPLTGLPISTQPGRSRGLRYAACLTVHPQERYPCRTIALWCVAYLSNLGRFLPQQPLCSHLLSLKAAPLP